MYVPSFSKALLISFGVFAFSKSYSQLTPARWEAGLNVGAYVYQGDLVPVKYGSFKTIKPGLGISFSRIFTPSFSMKGLFNLASLKGDDTKYGSVDEYRTYRAFKFKTTVKEVSVQAQWNVLGSTEYQTRFDPYIFAGAGLAFINTNRDYSAFQPAYFGEVNDIQPRLAQDLLQKTRRTVPVIPAGVGLRYNVTSNLGVNLEGTYRFTNSDYIDGYSISANPEKNDHYFSQTIGVSYKLGRKDKFSCPRRIF